jgi:hypothetical protein
MMVLCLEMPPVPQEYLVFTTPGICLGIWNSCVGRFNLLKNVAYAQFVISIPQSTRRA